MKRGARYTIWVLAVVGSIAAALLGLDRRTQADNARVEAIRSSVEAALRAELVLGHDPDRVESVLKKNKLDYTYSDVLKGYYASVPTTVPDSRVDIIIAVDEARKLRSISVKTFWISL